MVGYVINGETWLHDLGGVDVSYISDIPFEILDYGYTADCILGIIFVTWCIVKLYFYVDLCSACHILILDNDIIRLEPK